jgi:hypothetical protein
MIKKKTVIWISLIISFIMMIISIFSYFEIIRYYKVRYSSVESYINSYSNLSKASNNRVVLSFSITDDLDKYKGFLNSILDQTVKVDSIDINISEKYRSMNLVNPKYRKIVTLNYISADYGKFNGLLPTLERETDKDTIIIWVKPEYIYPSDMIQNMIEHMNKDDKMYTIKKNNRIVAIAVKPDEILSTCFYSSTNDNPEKIKSQNLSDISKSITNNISCSNLYNL